MNLNAAMTWFTRLIPLWAALVMPAWAQSPAFNQFKAQPKPGTSAPVHKAPSRVASKDITAQLQDLAAAEAAAAAQVRSLALGVTPNPVALAGEVSALVPPVGAAFAPQSAFAIEPTTAASPDQTLLPPLSPELLIAQQIHQGQLPCELGASIRIEADAKQPGFFNVHGKGFRYRMFPVQTSTGALRLEDKKAGAVWLQLANKSMLMDQKKGRRLADECAHPDQLAFAESMKTNPPPSLIDTKGMGR